MTTYLLLPHKEKKQHGFSLLEMAVVLVILGVLIGGLIVPLSSQRDDSKRRATETQFDEIQDALLGFAAINGYLPCPAAAGDGLSTPVGPTAACTAVYPTSYVPYRTLGIQGPLDQNGRLVDGWYFPIRYRLSVGYSNIITTATPAANLRVCTASACPIVAPDRILVANAVAVLVSLGPDGDVVPAIPANQTENTNNNFDFVMREISEPPASVFNDRVRWMSPNTLTLTLVKAGRL